MTRSLSPPPAATEILDNVLDVLGDGAHWMKGHSTDAKGNFCIVGAYYQICNRRSAFNSDYSQRHAQVYRALRTVVSEQFHDRKRHDQGATNIPSFNDHPDTDWNDVCLVFEKARILLAEQDTLLEEQCAAS